MPTAACETGEEAAGAEFAQRKALVKNIKHKTSTSTENGGSGLDCLSHPKKLLVYHYTKAAAAPCAGGKEERRNGMFKDVPDNYSAFEEYEAESQRIQRMRDRMAYAYETVEREDREDREDEYII